MPWRDIDIGSLESKNIVFRNKGREYRFILKEDKNGRKLSTIGGGNHMYVHDTSLIEVELVEEVVELVEGRGSFFKRYFIVMKEKIYSFEEIRETKVEVTKEELKNAELVVSFLKEIILQYTAKTEKDRWTISSNLDRNRYIKSLSDAKDLIQRRAEVFCYYDDDDYLRIIDILDKEIQRQKEILKKLY